MDTYGISFSPAQAMDKSQKPTDPNANVQEAIRTLALRIPKVTGAKGFAPDALMGASGASGAPQGALGLDRLLAMLFSGQALGQPQGQPQGMSAPSLGGGSAPAPRVTGIGNDAPAPQTFMPAEAPATPMMPEAPMPRTYNKPIMPGSY